MNCKDCAHAGKCETLFDNTEVCEDYRASLYPDGSAAKKEAQELGRRIRGEK